MVRITFTRVLAAVPAVAVTLSSALPTFPQQIPNGQNPALPCMELGHIDCVAGGPRNQFGMDFMANDFTWDETLCMMDSDGDGLTNGEELGDPCCTWRAGDDDSALRTENISHPGDETSTDAEGQDGCPDGGAPAAPAVTDDAPVLEDIPAPEDVPAPSAAVTPFVEAPEETGAPAAGAPMMTPKLMNASPIPTGIIEQVDQMPGEKPLATASPIPTGIVEQPEETGAPVMVGGDADPVAMGTEAPLFGTVTPTGTAGPDNTPNPDVQGILDAAAECFPADATVTLKDGSHKSMSQLSVGDEVLAALPDTYSPVYMFSHKESHSTNGFVRIVASNGLAITATRGHYIIVDGSLKAASAVTVGDKLMTKDGEAAVASTEVVKKTGLYNPHTLAGSVVVDGVLASDVTTAVRPSVARTLLAPFKFMYGMVKRDVSGGLLNNGWASLAKLAPAGAKEL